MSGVNYEAMSDAELRRYFLAHRQDPQALTAYLARRHQQTRPVIATVDDPDFEQKLQAAVVQKLTAAREDVKNS
ncbi:MAG: DUF6887 family protein [Spirulinaceae cyanobacterium]